MPRTNRNTLKEYFKRGSMPNQKHFYELIDSMVNIYRRRIDKNPDDGLRLAPSKEKQSRHQLIHEHTRQYSRVENIPR